MERVYSCDKCNPYLVHLWFVSDMHQEGGDRPKGGGWKTTHFGREKNFKLPIFGAEGAENLKNRRF